MKTFKQYLELEEGKLSKTAAAVAASAVMALAHAGPTSVDVQQNDKTFKIEASFEIDASPDVVYDVMTDFEHMSKFVPNLASSKVISGSGNNYKVQQKGSISVGLFDFDYESVREISATPRKRNQSKVCWW